MQNQTDQFEPGSAAKTESHLNAPTSLLTVSQAYDYLVSEGLPRSKKTIRKWCRLNHVEKKQNVIAGGPKWLITKTSLDARIAEEKLIDASLTKRTGSDRSEPVSLQTGANPSGPVRDDELVEVLKQQLAHERAARKATDDKNRELIRMYHEIAMASTQFGIEIGKGMQEQGKARQLGGEKSAGPNRSDREPRKIRTMEAATAEDPPSTEPKIPDPVDHDGDNERPMGGADPIE